MDNTESQNSDPNDSTAKPADANGEVAANKAADQKVKVQQAVKKNKTAPARPMATDISLSQLKPETKQGKSKRSGFVAREMVRFKGKTYGPGSEAGNKIPADIDDVTLERWKQRGLVECG